MHAASAQIGDRRREPAAEHRTHRQRRQHGPALGQVFGSGTGFWGLGAALTQPIFDGGTLLHKERAARAAYIQASEQYRTTVLTAFQNVADTLVALDQDARALKANAAAVDAAKATQDLSERQFKDGYASYLSLLSAEQAYQQARINLVQAQASRYADTVALFQALGGGWWRRSDLAKDMVRTGLIRRSRACSRPLAAAALSSLAGCSPKPESEAGARHAHHVSS